MRASAFSALLALCSTAFAELDGTHRPKGDHVPSLYILELHHGASIGRRSGEHTHEVFARRAIEADVKYDVRYEYKEPDLFYGLSMRVHNNESLAKLQELLEIAKIWPVSPGPQLQLILFPARLSGGFLENLPPNFRFGMSLTRSIYSSQ
ncbi:hypothetical protein HJFPF1_02251 [Paramyrothecium foliicola]|nr:hypothetical protein HJFPF1_02251 [Paramyrothecium foliicola]